MSKPSSYQVRAFPHVLANGTVNDGSLAGVKFRVRSTYERDAAGNELANVEDIRGQVAAIIGRAKPGSGTWTYAVTLRGETFERSMVTV
jgi:hypothetical protein